MIAETLQVDNETYHAATDMVSNSMLSVLINDGPAMFKARFIDKTIPNKTTDEMLFGTIVHEIALLGKTEAVPVPPSVLDKRGARTGPAWKEFAAANSGKTLITPDDIMRAGFCVSGLYGNDAARRLLFDLPGLNEQAVRWTDNRTGLTCKMRFDRAVQLSTPWLLDIKTCRDPRPKPFKRTFVDRGYYRQAAFYSRGYQSLTGDWPCFAFIAVRSEPPYDCVVHEIDELWRDAGLKEIDEAMDQLVKCRETGDWRSPEERDGSTIEMTEWEARRWGMAT